MVYSSHKFYFVLLIAFVFSTKIFSQKTSGSPNKSISLTLAFPKSKSENIISVENDDSTYDISLTIENNTDTLATFYDSWNAWGFYNISFELITNDTAILIKRVGGCWDKNFPSATMLFPGDSLIFSYNIAKCTNHSCDCFLNLPKKLLKGAKIRAVYELEKVNHAFSMETVSKHGELMLCINSSHPQLFKKLSLSQKMKSYVADKLYSKEYQIQFIADN